jgi:methionine-rich copper-binding protein CopC
MRRALLVLAVVVATVVLSATPVAAHTELTSTTPADQQTVSRTPAVVILTFSEPALTMGTQIVVTGPQGPVQAGPPKLVDNSVSQNIEPGSPAGHYAVAWRVTSGDGHPISGTFAFTAEAPGDGEPAIVSPSDTAGSRESGSSAVGRVWIWLLPGVVVLAALVGVARRRTGRDATPGS